MANSYSVCVYTEYSNNDIADVYTFDTENPNKHIRQVGAYMLMRSIKSNGFDRGRVGIVNLSFFNKNGHNLFQFFLREDGVIGFVRPKGANLYYRKDSDIWKSLVKNGFEFCMEQGIIF